MELVIVVAIVTLGWGARMTPWRTVNAPVRFAQAVVWWRRGRTGR